MYIQVNFCNIGYVICVFNVLEWIVCNWWKGDFGVVGGYVVIVVCEYGFVVL